MQNIKIRSRRNNSGSTSYMVDWKNPVSRRRERKFFPTKKAASEFADTLKVRHNRLGDLASKLNARQSLEAVIAFEKLAPFNVSLTDAVDFYLRQAQPKQGKIKFTDLAEEVLRLKVRANCMPKYLKELGGSLRRFAKSFGDHFVNEITSRQVEAWLDSQNYGSVTRANYIRNIGIAFNFAKARGHCAENVMEHVQKPRLIEKPAGILTDSQAFILLHSANAVSQHRTRKGTVHNLVPYIAIGLFAGLRSSELETLDWSEINLVKKRIEIKAEKSKTARRRYVDISKNLAEWIAPHKQLSGPIIRKGWREQLQKISKESGLDEWPRNALRHSFGSYHLAFHNDAGKTALQMGHESTKMLFKHYRSLVTKEAAERYWSIVPPQKGEWLIPMPEEGDYAKKEALLEKISELPLDQIKKAKQLIQDMVA